MQYYRRPRTKKRRILKKWRKRPENYRPLMVPVGHVILIGALAKSRAIPSDNPNPYWNEEDPSRPRIMEMHTNLWEKVQSEVPQFAELCDVFRRVETVRNGITWSEDVPFQQNDKNPATGSK
jgi:hypothetical protein